MFLFAAMLVSDPLFEHAASANLCKISAAEIRVGCRDYDQEAYAFERPPVGKTANSFYYHPTRAGYLIWITTFVPKNPGNDMREREKEVSATIERDRKKPLKSCWHRTMFYRLLRVERELSFPMERASFSCASRRIKGQHATQESQASQTSNLLLPREHVAPNVTFCSALRRILATTRLCRLHRHHPSAHSNVG
jgi:hypothetical protein